MSLIVDIQKQIGDFRLNVSFETPGGTLGILGASGTGKSVTLQCIAGILRPDAGRIELNGRVLFDSGKKIFVPPQKRGVGYLFQQYALFPNMTVRQNIFAGVRRGSRQEKREKTEQALRTFRLTDTAEQYPATLSGGQQQRTALARILVGEPEAILLDEPFSAMDRHLREQLMWELSRTLETYQGDVLIVSHEREEITRFCDRAVVMDRGTSEPAQNVEDILKEPRTVADAKLAGYFNIAGADMTGNGRVRVPAWGAEWKIPDADRPFGAVCVPEDAVAVLTEESEGSVPCTVAGVTRGPEGEKILLHPLSAEAETFLLSTGGTLGIVKGQTVWASVPADCIRLLEKTE